jgi:hypothetical protein
MQSTYAALTGAEIRRLTKTTINTEVDRLRYLSAGNSFHRASIQFGFTMTAYPADVPVPEKTYEFDIDAATADSPEALKQYKKVEELDEQIAKLQQQRETVENLILEAQELRSTLVFESEVSADVDGAFPDKVRIEHGLDVPVMETKGGKTQEVMVPAVNFKKVS